MHWLGELARREANSPAEVAWINFRETIVHTAIAIPFIMASSAPTGDNYTEGSTTAFVHRMASLKVTRMFGSLPIRRIKPKP